MKPSLTPKRHDQPNDDPRQCEGSAASFGAAPQLPVPRARDQSEELPSLVRWRRRARLGRRPVPTDADIAELLVTFVMEGNIGFDGEDFRINQSFRVILAAESGLVILVDLADPALSETFNYIFAGSQSDPARRDRRVRVQPRGESMFRRKRRHALHLVAALLLSGLTWAGMGLHPSPARAYHTYEERLLDTTAYSLHRRRVRLGLMNLSYGIIDQLQVTTYTMPWLLGVIFQDVAPNLELKSTFYDRKRLALSVSAGFLTGTILQTDDSKVRYFLMPISLASSVRINSDVSVHLGARFTAVTGGAESQPEGSDQSKAQSSSTFFSSGRWPNGDSLAWSRLHSPSAGSPMSATSWSMAVSAATRPPTSSSRSTDARLQNAFAVIPGFVFSWDRANIRLGVGYSDFFVDGFYLVVPGDVLSNVSPEFDVFVRF